MPQPLSNTCNAIFTEENKNPQENQQVHHQEDAVLIQAKEVSARFAPGYYEDTATTA